MAKKTGQRIISIAMLVCVIFSLSINSAFASNEYGGIIPRSNIKTLTYTLSAGQSVTTYKYSIPSGNNHVSVTFSIETPGASIAGTLYGANSTSSANNQVASGSGTHNDSTGSEGANFYISASNTYPMYCVNVKNTSSKTTTVKLTIFSD